MKFKVFLPAGTIQTLIADKFLITDKILRFYNSDGHVIAFFPEGGWHGVQDMSAHETRKVEV